MSRAAEASVVSVPRDRGDLRSALGAIVESTKPRITRMVMVTGGVGFAMGAVTRTWSLGELLIAALWCLLGTGLSAAGANALNQWMERERDARMPRTATRPLPEGRLTPGAVFAAGVAMAGAGVGLLWIASGAVPAAVSLLTIALYLLAYTPLKPLTPLSTLVGAIPGALPPLIGWAAARPEAGWGSLAEPGGWTLFLIMFVWQIPHFLAIAWMYQDDYARGGYRVLPMGDRTGWWTAVSILAWSAVLLPVTLAPALVLEIGPGPGYFVVAVASGAAFFWLASRLAVGRTRDRARATFLASIVHLPLILVVLVADTMIAAVW